MFTSITKLHKTDWRKVTMNHHFLKTNIACLILHAGECGSRDIYLGSDKEAVTLITPGYPIAYRNELICEWIVNAAGGRRIIVDIIDFDMENKYDFLIVGNGENSAIKSSVIARLTGETRLRTLTSAEDTIWLKVASDRTGTGRGFEIELTRTATVEGIVSRRERREVYLL